MTYSRFAVPCALLLAVGCQNTVCTIGNETCDGEVIERCIGPDEGGDADGELETVRDCGAEGLACWIDVYEGPAGEVRVSGCTSSECRTMNPCFQAGSTSCSLGTVMTCTDVGGCLRWQTTTDCTGMSQECIYVGGQAMCGTP